MTENSAARLLPKGTVILSRTASVGFSGIMATEMATTQDFVNWLCGERVRPEYLLYVFRSMGHEFRRLTMGSTHQTIYMPDVGKFSTPIPPILEQHRIVAFISKKTAKIDALVAKKEQVIELLQEKRTALITQAVTKGLDPSVPMKDSGVEWLGEIPAHWEVVRLGRVARVGNGSTPRRDDPNYWIDGDVPWLTSGKINDGVITEAGEFVTDLALRECHLPLVPRGSVLVAITGEGQTRGRAALLQVSSTINQHLAFLTPDEGRVTAPYLWRFLESKYDRLRIESSGGGSTRGALTCEFLKSIPITVPPVAEQRGIVEFVNQQDEQLGALAATIRRGTECLKELRTALISAAVTGRIDVREEVA